VTPNSTCPNWRREIKKWVPGIRVVAYYGGKDARDKAYQHELFPDGFSAGDMRAHVVVTSYDAPVSDAKFFQKIKWTGMIVDEGQRLKNEDNLLYSALTQLEAPFKALLTGNINLSLQKALLMFSRHPATERQARTVQPSPILPA